LTANSGKSLLSTRIHPEAAENLDQVRAEFARLGAVVGGAANSRQEYQSAMNELRLALDAHPDTTVGFVNVSLDQSVEDLKAWITRFLAEPQIVGIGELTPAPGAAARIEPGTSSQRRPRRPAGPHSWLRTEHPR
jgi:uncharacterized protein